MEGQGIDAKRWLKVNRSLLGKTALLGLGAVWTLAKAGSPGTEAVWTVTSGIISSLGANEIEALLERFRNHGEVLRNEDLAKAAGRTVGKTLEERIIPQFPKLRTGLHGLADRVEDYWLQRVQSINVFETLQEEQLYHLFSQTPEGFSNYQVLTTDEWQELSEDLVDWGCGRGILPGERAKYGKVVAALAGELAANFGKYLRQVLKDDPKAFAGMVLDLHGATLAQLQEIQQYLPKLAHREDVERVLQRMEELVRDELGELRAVLQQFVDNNKPKLSQLPLSLSSTVEEIEITVLILNTGQRLTTTVPKDLLLKILKISLVQKLGLPNEFSNGWLVDYVMMNRTQNKLLKDELTVRENQICNGDTLVFMVAQLAG